MSSFSFTRILAWRKKTIRDKSLVFALSIIIGIIAGLAAVILKTSVQYIEHFFKNTSNIEKQDWFYLLIPLAGILLTVLYVCYVKDNISRGVLKYYNLQLNLKDFSYK